jgi:FMN phosphatase YigB (HAD superfamily)
MASIHGVEKTVFNKYSIFYKNVNDLLFFQQQIKKDTPSISKTLIIFDIDDTLLTSTDFVGSNKWYHWQRGKKSIDPHGHFFTIKPQQKFNCIFRTLGTLFEMGATQLTQKNAVSIFNHTQSLYDQIILTARTTHYRQATERELKKHHFIFPQFITKKDLTLDFTFHDAHRVANVTYKNGIIMASGLNKALVLKEILKKTNKTYTHIYFIDDSLKNIQHMKNFSLAFKKTSDLKIHWNLFHYRGIKQSITTSEIKQSNQAKKYFDHFLNKAFSSTFLQFKKDQCYQ